MPGAGDQSLRQHPGVRRGCHLADPAMGRSSNRVIGAAPPSQAQECNEVWSYQLSAASLAARLRWRSLCLLTTEAPSTPMVTPAMRMVQIALISGVTPSRTWL